MSTKIKSENKIKFKTIVLQLIETANNQLHMCMHAKAKQTRMAGFLPMHGLREGLTLAVHLKFIELWQSLLFSQNKKTLP